MGDLKRGKNKHLCFFVAWNFVLFLIVALAPRSQVIAAEIDELSTILQKGRPQESAVHVETLIYTMLAESVEELNSDGSAVCSKTALYKKLRKHYHNHFFGDFVKRLNKIPEFDKISIPIRDSVLADFGFFEAFGLAPIFSGSRTVIAPIMTLHNVVMGTDKLEHFFDFGFKYFYASMVQAKGFDAGLRIGVRSEMGLLGRATTGIYSYADLAANFEGMRFWNDLLGDYQDPLNNPLSKPYLSCKANRWVINHPIRLKRYVNESWSESKNCVGFRNQNLLNKVLSLSLDAGLNCHMNQKSFKHLKRVYGPFHSHVLNPYRTWHVKGKY